MNNKTYAQLCEEMDGKPEDLSRFYDFSGMRSKAKYYVKVTYNNDHVYIHTFSHDSDMEDFYNAFVNFFRVCGGGGTVEKGYIVKY